MAWSTIDNSVMIMPDIGITPYLCYCYYRILYSDYIEIPNLLEL